MRIYIAYSADTPHTLVRASCRLLSQDPSALRATQMICCGGEQIRRSRTQFALGAYLLPASSVLSAVRSRARYSHPRQARPASWQNRELRSQYIVRCREALAVLRACREMFVFVRELLRRDEGRSRDGYSQVLARREGLLIVSRSRALEQ